MKAGTGAVVGLAGMIWNSTVPGGETTVAWPGEGVSRVAPTPTRPTVGIGPVNQGPPAGRAHDGRREPWRDPPTRGRRRHDLHHGNRGRGRPESGPKGYVRGLIAVGIGVGGVRGDKGHDAHKLVGREVVVVEGDAAAASTNALNAAMQSGFTVVKKAAMSAGAGICCPSW